MSATADPTTASRQRTRAAYATVAAGVTAAILGGCGTETKPPTTTADTITVFAAASLTKPFAELARQFEIKNPGQTVTLSFGPSSGLATQITNGSPADVFAAASTTTMAQVVDAGAALNPTIFATNSMAIAMPKDNPANVTSLIDLAKPSVKTAVCQTAVPCGFAATAVFNKAKISVQPVTYEADVRAVLSKVALGEVDAGMVYVTDVKASQDQVVSVAIPPAQNANTSYAIAALSRSANRSIAAEFVSFVLSAQGSQVLAAAGFARP